MKRTIAMLLALVLALGLLAVPASAETVKGEGDTAEGAVLTTGQDVPEGVEMETVTVYGEGVPDGVEMETVTVYGKDVPEDVEMETVTVYGEEESGFLGWLKNVWNSILRFFGL